MINCSSKDFEIAIQDPEIHKRNEQPKGATKLKRMLSGDDSMRSLQERGIYEIPKKARGNRKKAMRRDS